MSVIISQIHRVLDFETWTRGPVLVFSQYFQNLMGPENVPLWFILVIHFIYGRYLLGHNIGSFLARWMVHHVVFMLSLPLFT